MRGCDRFRDFQAEPRNPRLGLIALRKVPKPQFDLRDGPLNVSVWVNSKRIKFVNRSKFLVNAYFTQRCKV